MDLKKENENLRKQLAQLGDARNREILDIQHNFAERIRELEKMKGLDREGEVQSLKEKIQSLERDLLKQKEENLEQKKTIRDLENKLKESEIRREQISYSLEKARIDALKAASQPPPEPAFNIEEILSPLEEQVACLADVIAEKQEEINRLQKLVQEECEERVKLQLLLGLTPKTQQ